MAFDLPAGLEVAVLLGAAGWILLAALVRGYSGFGSAAIAVAGLSMTLPPAKAIPLVLLLEILAGVHMLPSVWRHIDWRQLAWISAGAVVATPVGVHLLASAPAQTMRVVISLLILGAALLVGLGLRIPGGHRRGTILTAGLVSGTVNGAAGVGGLPLVVFFLSKDEQAATFRATLVAFLMGIDIYTCSLAAARGLITIDVLWMVALLAPPLLLGTALGSLHFRRTRPEHFRKVALTLLVLIASGGLLRALWTW